MIFVCPGVVLRDGLCLSIFGAEDLEMMEGGEGTCSWGVGRWKMPLMVSMGICTRPSDDGYHQQTEPGWPGPGPSLCPGNRRPGDLFRIANPIHPYKICIQNHAFGCVQNPTQ